MPAGIDRHFSEPGDSFERARLRVSRPENRFVMARARSHVRLLLSYVRDVTVQERGIDGPGFISAQQQPTQYTPWASPSTNASR